MQFPVRVAWLSLFVLSCGGPSRAEPVYIVSQAALGYFDGQTGAPGLRGIGVGSDTADFDLAISQDGSKLYHLSGLALRILNPQTLDLLPGPESFTKIPDRAMQTGRASASMTLDPSGSFLYLLTLHSSDIDQTTGILTFDTAAKGLLARNVKIGECQGVRLLPLPQERHLIAVCGGDSAVHFLEIAPDGSLAHHDPLIIQPLPTKPFSGPRVDRNDTENAFRQSALTPDGSTLLLARLDGRLLKVDVASQSVTAETVALPSPAIQVMPLAPAISPDGSVWYVSARKQNSTGGSDRIFVVDTGTLSVRSTIVPQKPFSGLALSRDGERLYLTDSPSGLLRVLNARTGELIRIAGKEQTGPWIVFPVAGN